ncbi:MAG TPA: surface-adhesin E family protein [Steroidobacteraceae bacterium]
MPRTILLAAAVALAGTAALPPLAYAEQWAYAMQTGHGNHSIQVDVDSIIQQPGYVAVRLLYEYYWNSTNQPDAASGPPPRSALVEGAFDCKGNRFQVLSRTEYAAAEAKGPAGTTTRSTLSAQAWRPASADPETHAIIDWVCSVAAHKLANGQAGSMP